MSLDGPALREKDKPDLSSFDWEDPFYLDRQLTDEERMIAESARSFARNRCSPA
jgi:glutaryl-CoA dehydrogenase